MYRKILILILLVAVPFFCSCFPKRIPTEERTPHRVLDKLMQQEQRLHSLAVLLGLKAKSQQGGISSNLEFYWVKPDSFAFYFQSIFGTNGVRGRLIKDSLQLYSVGGNRYFKGDCSELQDSAFPIENIKLWVGLAAGIYGFQEKQLTDLRSQGDEIIYRFEDGEGIWEWWVDSKKARVQKGIFLSKQGRCDYRLNLKSYFETKGFRFPRLIEIRSLRGDEWIKLRFVERKVNYPVPSSKFDLKIPPSAVRIDALNQF